MNFESFFKPCCIGVLFSCWLNCQNENIQQFWPQYELNKKLNSKLDLEGKLGIVSTDPKTWNRYYINGLLNFEWPKHILKNLNYREYLSFGLDLLFTNNFDEANRLEIRPTQSFTFSWPYQGKIRLRHRIRLDERFELNTEDWVNTFGLRLSYELKLTLVFTGDIWSLDKGFYIPTSLELFANLLETDQFNDRVRLTVGLGYSINEKWKTELLFGFDYSKFNTDGDYRNTGQLIRINIFHDLNF